MVGHGSSDNAASYGVYAFGLLPRLDGAARLDLADRLLRRRAGHVRLHRARAVAVGPHARRRRVRAPRAARGAYASRSRTTRRRSSHAKPTRARARAPGRSERSRRRRRTRTRSQRSACSLRTRRARVTRSPTGCERVADAMPRFVESIEARIAEVAIPFAYAGRMFVVGRGPEFATAREIALKLLETCRIAAEPLTATDLAHGPVAALDSLFPVWAIASDDAMLPAVVEAVERAREAGATIVASGSAAEAIPGAEYVLPSPKAPSALLAPLLSVDPRPALRVGSRPRERARSGLASRAVEGDAGALTDEPARATARRPCPESPRADDPTRGRARARARARPPGSERRSPPGSRGAVGRSSGTAHRGRRRSPTRASRGTSGAPPSPCAR